jgi:hypothetical protein
MSPPVQAAEWHVVVMAGSGGPLTFGQPAENLR